MLVASARLSTYASAGGVAIKVDNEPGREAELCCRGVTGASRVRALSVALARCSCRPGLGEGGVRSWWPKGLESEWRFGKVVTPRGLEPTMVAR